MTQTPLRHINNRPRYHIRSGGYYATKTRPTGQKHTGVAWTPRGRDASHFPSRWHAQAFLNSFNWAKGGPGFEIVAGYGWEKEPA